MDEAVSGAIGLAGETLVVEPAVREPIAPPSAVVPQMTFRPIGALALYANNPRKHSDEQIEQLAASIVEFGWTVPVLEDATGVVAGHGRIKAASLVYEQVGCTLEFPDGTPIPFGHVPVLPCDGWSEERRRAYVIVDNQLPNNADWDDAKLAEEVQALLQTEFDMGLLGFEADVLTTLQGGYVEKPSHPINDIERNTLLIEFENESELQAAFDELTERGWSVKIMS